MNIDDTFKLLAIISSAYPRSEFTEPQVKLWHEMLKDLDFRTAQVALKTHILNNTFPPAIADIRKAHANITTDENEQLTAADAWGEVMRAVKKYGTYNQEEAFKMMSPRTAQVAKYIGFYEICMSDRIDVIRGQFVKMYDQVITRDRKEKLLPMELKKEIKMISEKMAMLEGDS